MHCCTDALLAHFPRSHTRVKLNLECTGQTVPEPAGMLDVRRVKGRVPSLGAVDEEAVGEGASGRVAGILGYGDGAELGGAAVDVSRS